MTTSATSPIDQTSTTAAAQAASAAASNAGRTRLADNFNMFLTLLTTQMKNQDPTSPMDSSQFMSQLVQMTGVEQQLAGNDLLKQLVANTGTNLSSAVDMIGKQVRAATNDATLANGKASWGYNLDTDAADVKIEVLDSRGIPVRIASAAAADNKAGEHSFVWDGKDGTGAKMPDGVYTLRLTPKDSSGTVVSNSVFVQGVVTALENQNGSAVLTLNGGKVGIGTVISVSLPPAATTPVTSPAGAQTATGTTTTPTADQTSAEAA